MHKDQDHSRSKVGFIYIPTKKLVIHCYVTCVAVAVGNKKKIEISDFIFIRV